MKCAEAGCEASHKKGWRLFRDGQDWKCYEHLPDWLKAHIPSEIAHRALTAREEISDSARRFGRIGIFLFSLLSSFAASAQQTTPTTLAPPSLIWGGGARQVPTPMQIVGYDSSTSRPCIIGFSATCSLATAGSAPSGGATAANQATQITAEQAIQATVGATGGAAVTTDANGTLQQYLRGLVKLWGTGLTVTGTFWQATQPVSAASLPLPTGAALDASITTTNTDIGPPGATTCATDTGSCSLNALTQRLAQRLTSIIGQLPATLGQAVSASSLAVVLPSDPDIRPVSQNVTIIDTGSTTTAGFNSVNLVTGTPTVGSVASQAINGQSAATLTVSGTWAGTLTFEVSGDGGTTWVASTLRQRGSANTSATTTGNAVFQGDVSSATNIRVRATAAMTGTAAVKYAFGQSAGPVQVQNALPTGSNVVGKVGVDQTTPGTTNLVSAGFSQQIASDPTVQNASYVSGNCIGGFNAVTVSANNGQSGFVTNFRVVSVGGLTPTITVYLFDSNPSASICTDKSTFTLNSADIDKLIANPNGAAFTLAAPTGTTVAMGSTDFTPPKPFIAGGSTASGVKTIYYALVSGSTWTPASTTDVHTRIGVVLN